MPLLETVYNYDLYKNLFGVIPQKPDGDICVRILGNNSVVDIFKVVFWYFQIPMRPLKIYIDGTDKNREVIKELVDGNSSLKERISYAGEKAKNEYAKIEFVDNKEDDTNIYDCTIHDNLTVYAKEKVIGEGKELDTNDLERLAYNINFSYELKNNPRTNYEKSKIQLDKNLSNKDSSLAAALHIPCKLYYCCTENGGGEYSFKKGEELLREAVNNFERSKKSLFNKLMTMEHRRWNAYMISIGVGKPTENELREYFFKGNDDWKKRDENGNIIFHPAICECGDLGEKLTYQGMEIWENSDDKLSELDKQSLLCNRIANDIVDNKIIDNIVRELNESNSIAHRFLKNGLCKKLINSIHNLYYINSPHSAYKYRGTIQEIFEYLKNASITDPNKDTARVYIEKLDERLKVFEFRACHEDFFASDAQQIRLLPFCLWYGKEYKQMVIISNGNAYEDIIASLIFVPQKIIVIGNINDSYKKIIKIFLKEYGNNSDVISFESIKIDRYSSNDLLKLIEKSNKFSNNDFVVSVGNIRQSAYLLEHFQKKKIPSFNSNISNFYRDENGILHYDKNIGPIYSGIERKKISVTEMCRLQGWTCDEKSYTDIESFNDLAKNNIFSGEKYKALEIGNKKNRVEKLKWRQFISKIHKSVGEIQDFDTIFHKYPESILYDLHELKIIDDYVCRKLNNDNHICFRTMFHINMMPGKLLKNEGELLEYYAFNRLNATGYFDDIENGITITYNTGQGTKNEVDIIAIKDYKPVLISCKDRTIFDDFDRMPNSEREEYKTREEYNKLSKTEKKKYKIKEEYVEQKKNQDKDMKFAMDEIYRIAKSINGVPILLTSEKLNALLTGYAKKDAPIITLTKELLDKTDNILLGKIRKYIEGYH